MPKTILFVCTGNTCRSYMAQAIARDYLSGLKDKEAEIKILSAGTGALEGEGPSFQAETVLREMGLEAGEHRSVYLSPELIREADLILAMTQRHINDILRREPQAGEKVFLLKEFAADQKARRRLEEQAQKLYQEIESRRRAFFEEHREEIGDLERQKKELLEKLRETEEKLAMWEDRLSRVAESEESALRKIEEELKDKDILDPFGQPVEYYRTCAAQLREYVVKALDNYLSGYKQEQ